MSNARINLFWLIIFTLTLPLAVVISTHLARKSFEKVQLRGQTVTVKGYAEKPIVSDRAEWSTTIVERHEDRTAAYVSLEKHRGALLEYLERRGFANKDVTLGPVQIDERYTHDSNGNATNDIERYDVSQWFSIASTDVQAVAGAARDAGDLIAAGIELQSEAPSYLYTKLEELKLTLLKEATDNGRSRAEILASSSGNKLGPLRSASQGVFQITPAFSTEVSGEGENDTSSLHKVVKAVVTVEYAIAE